MARDRSSSSIGAMVSGGVDVGSGIVTGDAIAAETTQGLAGLDQLDPVGAGRVALGALQHPRVDEGGRRTGRDDTGDGER